MQLDVSTVHVDRYQELTNPEEKEKKKRKRKKKYPRGVERVCGKKTGGKKQGSSRQ